MGNQHPTDDLPAYALGILVGSELQDVERHLEDCAECRSEVAALKESSARLAYLAPAAAPPARLRQRILQQVQPGQPVRRSRLSDWWHNLNPGWGLAALAVIAILVVSNLVLWDQVRALARQTPQENFLLVSLAGVNSGKDGHGVMILTDNGKTGTLVVDGLPALTADQQYQLWLIVEGKRTNGGVFSVDSSGYGAMVINSLVPLNTFTDFGVTIEPAGGSPGPTGEKVLGGSL
jgi:anti-sigma-K factor RskA